MEKVIRIKGGRSLVVRTKPVETMKTGVLEEPVQRIQMAQPMQYIPVPSYQSYPSPHSQTEGVAIPNIKTEKAAQANEEEIQRINMQYPLIPSSPAKGERVFAYAHIFFNQRSGELVYEVIEPSLGENARLLAAIKEYIEEKLDINFAQIRKGDAIGYLNVVFSKALTYFNAKLDKEATDILRYYVVRDFIGLEKIEPLMQDKYIEDISCDGANIPIFVYHRLPQFGSVKTSITFNNRDLLDSFVNKLSERCGRTISVAKPLLDGTLPNGSRLQATLGSDIARNGSNFTIRMFSDKPMTPVDLIKSGTCDLKMMAYFWMLIEHGSSVLISGGTASGKTSLLNLLSLFIKPQMKIISIEDTSEIRLPHTHWVPEVARTPISEEGKVDMFELLRESLRQRPDYIIVGEVRGKEAYVLFQQMAVGHPGLSTIHAENFSKLVDRMTSPPINLPPNLMENLDLILFLKRVKQGRKYLRRIQSLIEMVGVDAETSSPRTNEILKWDPKADKYTTINKSYLLRKVADTTGMSEATIKEELKKRYKVIKWMYDKNITDYRKISYILNLFYSSPDALLHRLEGS